MNIEIVKKVKEPLLHRTRVIASVTEDKSPSRVEIKKSLATSLGIAPEKVVVEKISTRFGGGSFDIVAKLYESEEFAKTIEQKYIIKRNDAAIEKKEEPKAEESSEASEEKKEESEKKE